MKKIFYSIDKKCLVYTKEEADSKFWDFHWNTDAKDSLKMDILAGKNDLFVAPITKKFLKPKKSCRILEGGCGKGSYVYSLECSGYDAYGVDYAEKTIRRIQQAIPKLKVVIGDVRSLPYDNEYFDGYWSLGVIEHFWDGFGPIATEMNRVLKKGGYLFLTFPCLSPLRKKNISARKYPLLKGGKKPDDFYQFALDPELVRKHFQKIGFSVVRENLVDGLKGILDETHHPVVFRLLYKFYNTKNPILRIIKLGISVLTAPYSGHLMLFVLKKQSS